MRKNKGKEMDNMGRSRETNLENKRCDTCGVTGYNEYLVVCNQCEQACEHVYCMKTNLIGVPAIWFCEACRLQKESHSEARSHPVKIKSPMQKSMATAPRTSYLKLVETGRVKCIPPEEAIMLASGTQKKKANICSASQSHPTDGMRSSRTPPVSTLHSKYLLQRQNVNSKKVAVRTQPPYCDMVSHDKPNLGEKLELSNVEGTKATVVYPSQHCESPSTRYSGTKAPVVYPSQHCESPSTRNSEPANMLGEASLIDSQFLKYVQEKNLAVISPRFEEDHENPPSLDCTWKGSFEVVNMTSCSHFYDGFQAHPPTKVSLKAYMFSKKMSGILQFKLQKHSDIWAEVFDSYSPSGNDIALYFFPGDFERSTKMYDALYEYLEVHDFAMKSCLDGVELLIFTSKQLPLDSRINMESYLWGVFHHVDSGPSPTDVLLSSSLLAPGELQMIDVQSLKNNNPEVVNMEIDMIGGRDVGRIDIVKNVLPLLASGHHEFPDAPPGFAAQEPTKRLGSKKLEVKKEKEETWGTWGRGQKNMDGVKAGTSSQKPCAWDCTDMESRGKGVKIRSLDEIDKAANTTPFISQELIRNSEGSSRSRNQFQPISIEVKKEKEEDRGRELVRFEWLRGDKSVKKKDHTSRSGRS